MDVFPRKHPAVTGPEERPSQTASLEAWKSGKTFIKIKEKKQIRSAIIHCMGRSSWGRAGGDVGFAFLAAEALTAGSCVVGYRKKKHEKRERVER